MKQGTLFNHHEGDLLYKASRKDIASENPLSKKKKMKAENQILII